MKKVTALLLIVGMVMTFTGCSSQEHTAQTGAGLSTGTAAASRPREEMTVGICLPDEAQTLWSAAGQQLQQQLSALGYPVELVYADADAREQAQQLEELIARPVSCLIVAAVDSAALIETAQKANTAGIPIVAFDRLLMDTQAVSYYVSYDYRAIGSAIGQAIVKAKGLDAPERSYTIEFFMGSPEDNNALLLHRGILEVLQPYLDSGTLVCPTGRTAFEDTCIVDWSEEAAKNHCADYLAEYYTEQKLDICCTVWDGFAAGCIAALEEAGYSLQTGWPVITGHGATEAGIENIRAGKQIMSAAVDAAGLYRQCVQMVDAVLTGSQPELNDTETCHNNVLSVPAFLCGFETVDAQDYPPLQSEPEPTDAPTDPAAKTGA